jgi:hypothetical protein
VYENVDQRFIQEDFFAKLARFARGREGPSRGSTVDEIEPMHPEPILRRKLYQEVLDRLLARIENGEIAPGDPLPSERELMEAYGVGRPAIREALQALQRPGW